MSISDSIWNDVRFDHIAADQAVDSLLGLARRLDEHRLLRSEALSMATAQWMGPYRDLWVDDYQRLQRLDIELSEAARADARVISAASRNAIHEQHRREALRAVWGPRPEFEAAPGEPFGAPVPTGGLEPVFRRDLWGQAPMA